MQSTNWDDYQVFLAVAETRQLVRAGKLLRVNPTTIGRRLRRLETRLGQTLFEQTLDGQVLTEAGERLLTEVESMAAAANRISQVSEQEGGLSGSLRISVPEGFGTWFLAEYLHEFASCHPRLTIDLVANSSYLSLSKREADIAVFLSRPTAGPLIASRLTDYSLQLFASHSYLEDRGNPEDAASLGVGHLLISYIPDILYAPELRYLDEVHYGLDAGLRSSSINAQYRLAAKGSGIAVLPSFIGNSDPKLRIVLPNLRITRTLWLVTHKDTQNLRKVRLFKRWLENLTSQHHTILFPAPLQRS